MRHLVSLSLVLAVFWLINSGHYTPLLLSLAVASVALVVFVAHRMDVVDHETQPLHLTFRMPGYWLWLLKETVLANVDVVCRIWKGNKSISPQQFTMKVGQKTDMGKVIFANSITLTPGTVTVDLRGDTILVHALTRDAVEDLKSGSMDRRVQRLEE